MWLIEIIVVLFLILLNGFFAMCELAVVNSRHGRLEQLAEQGQKAARAALALAEKTPKHFLIRDRRDVHGNSRWLCLLKTPKATTITNAPARICRSTRIAPTPAIMPCKIGKVVAIPQVGGLHHRIGGLSITSRCCANLVTSAAAKPKPSLAR